LPGDLLDVRYTGPRGPLFLREQFERLAAEAIPVYWALSPLEPAEAWPDVLPLPGNVHRFPHGRLSEHLVERSGEPLARVIGVSRDASRPLRPSEFEPDADGLATIAIVYGEAESAALESRRVHYWALGGRHDRGSLLGGSVTAHYAGTPQGRRPEEVGPHGCTLVHFDDRAARTTAIATDVARWQNERLLVDETTTRESLEARLRERVEAISLAANGLDLLVGWTIAGDGPLLGELRRRGGADGLLDWLRQEFGQSRPGVWSVSLQTEFTGALPDEWYEQESIRGDVLRVLRQFELNADRPLGLEAYVSEKHLAGELGVVAHVEGPQRLRALGEAALLGVDLLTGEEPQA
jgi:hypothetical protein